MASRDLSDYNGHACARDLGMAGARGRSQCEDPIGDCSLSRSHPHGRNKLQKKLPKINLMNLIQKLYIGKTPVSNHDPISDQIKYRIAGGNWKEG